MQPSPPLDAATPHESRRNLLLRWGLALVVFGVVAGPVLYRKLGTWQPFPDTVGVWSWSMDTAAARLACEGVGTPTWNDAATPMVLTCAGPAPVDGFPHHEALFCEGRVCIVRLGVEEDVLEASQALLTERYGPPRGTQEGGELVVWTWTTGFPARITRMVRLRRATRANGQVVVGLSYVWGPGVELYE